MFSRWLLRGPRTAALSARRSLSDRGTGTSARTLKAGNVAQSQMQDWWLAGHADDARRSKPKKRKKRAKKRAPQKVEYENKNPTNGERGAPTRTVAEADRIELKRILREFRDSDEATLQLPSAYTNTERKYVHEMAEQLGLKSRSTGRGQSRFVTVRRAPAPAQPIYEPHEPPTLHLGNRAAKVLREHLRRYPPTEMDVDFRDQPSHEIDSFDHHDVMAEEPANNTNAFGPRRVDMERRVWFHQRAQQAKVNSQAYPEIMAKRTKLPAYAHADEIVQAVAKNAVTIISGETGCGKSTQVPQFLLEANPEASIICSQPRRISAIAIAERVAYEQCIHEKDLGGLIGYQVRLEKAVSNDTQLVFCTPGILLRKLQSDPTLSEYTHICIDEVHERDKNTEFLLIALRDLLSTRPELRLILMSATLQTETLDRYFSDYDPGPDATTSLVPAQVEMEGRTFPVQDYFLEHVLQMTGYVDPSKIVEDFAEAERLDDELADLVGRSASTAVAKKKSSEAAMLAHYQATQDDEEIDTGLILKVLSHIANSSDSEEAVLVFLPGWSEISEVKRILESTPPFSSQLQYLVLPLHSGISSKNQRLVLQPPPPGVRKIVLSTNIAETSLTIDDVAYVIDSGRAKEKGYDPYLKSGTLQTEWISRASAKQRKGRAGRTKEGVCYRLYSEQRHDSMREFVESELLRTPLEEMCLMCKKLDLAPGGPEDNDGIAAVLNKAMTPPHDKSVTNALELLVDIGAMEPGTNDLTDLGKCLSTMSLEPRVGKMVIWSYLLGCARTACNMGVGMSSKSPFILPPPTERQGANEARLQLSQESESDQITMHYVLERIDGLRNEVEFRNFCRENFLGASSLRMIRDIRKSLARELRSLGFPDPSRRNEYHNRCDNDESVWQASLVAGMYPNIATRRKGNAMFYSRTKQKMRVHVSSVNSVGGQSLKGKCKSDSEIICFGEMTKGEDTYTATHTTRLESPIPLMLLCGSELAIHPQPYDDDGMVNLVLDKWIIYRCDARAASDLSILRRRLNSAFWKCVADPSKGLSALTHEEKDAIEIVRDLLRYAEYSDA